MMSTGSIRSPCTPVMSPRWIMDGKLLELTAIGKGSISLAHTGLIPHKEAA